MMSACLDPFLSLSFLSFSSFFLASFFSFGLANGLAAGGIEFDEFAREWDGGEGDEAAEDSTAELVRRGPDGTESDADWWLWLQMAEQQHRPQGKGRSARQLEADRGAKGR